MVTPRGISAIAFRALARAVVMVVFGLGALLVGLPTAEAIDAPSIKDHIADPSYLLSKRDRADLVKKLTKVQKEISVDTALLLIEAEEDDLRPLGHEAWGKWHIGHDSETGLVIVMPLHGHSVLIQDHKAPVLSKTEATTIMRKERPGMSVADRAFAILQAADKLLRHKVKHRRPVGHPNRIRGMFYLSGALAVLMLAIVLTLNARARENEAEASRLPSDGRAKA